MHKVKARIIGYNNRKELENNDELDSIIISKIKELPEYQKAHKILLYYPKFSEINVLELMNDNKHFYFPITIDDEMFAAKAIGGLHFNEKGVLEADKYEIIEDIEIVICPLIAFDASKNWVEIGKDYNKYLSKRNLIKLGIGYNCQKVDNIEVSEDDIKMDYIVSEKEVIK